jgi:SPP1 gp7 family putative phage head morphogenesis protein
MILYGYHYTAASNVAGIKRKGFDLDRTGSGAGDVFGQGVYILPEDVDRATNKFYEREIGGTRLNLKLNLKKTHVVEIQSVSMGFAVGADGKRIDDFSGLPVNQVQAATLKGIPNARKKLEAALEDKSIAGPFGIVDGNVAIRKVLQDAGFDSLQIVNKPFNEAIGGSQIIAFDSKSVEVIESIEADKAKATKTEKKPKAKTSRPKPGRRAGAAATKTANEEFADAFLRHQIYLLRYAGQLRNEVWNVLDATEEDLADKIRSRLANNAGLRTSVEFRRLESLMESIEKIRGQAWEKATEIMESQAVQLAKMEPVFVSEALRITMPVVIETVMPTAARLKAIALKDPFEGRILSEWAADMEANDLRNIRSAIQNGMVAGEDMATISRRVVGTKALQGSDGVTEMTRRSAATIARSAVIDISNRARDEFFKENADIVEMERFVATLDSRTTPICRANDGKQFPLGEGPRPILHFNCRSLRIAALDGILLGDRPAKPYIEKDLVKQYAKDNGLGDISSRDALPRGTKTDFDKWKRKEIRNLVGPVPASTTYNEWLKGQSNSFQSEVLGDTKAQLFRDGGLSLDKFVNRNGDELTLAQLAKTEKAAFKAAGLDPDDF